METLKQRTVDGTEYRLLRQDTDTPGKQYEYKIKVGAGTVGEKEINPGYEYNRRAEAEQDFNDIISRKQSSAGNTRAQSNRGQSGGGVDSFFDGGGSGPQMPDFGGIGSGMDDDDDDGSQFPWF